MGRWIVMALCILLIVAGTYWFLQHSAVASCEDAGGVWDYSRWTCNEE
jgi:hypothetical protein